MITHQALLSDSEDRLNAKRSLILAIDDDDDNLFLLNCALELLDCEFVGKTSGRSALAFVQERQPDLILLDVILPDIHGVEFARQLKQDVRTQNIPVIAVTGLATSEDRAELLEAGFSDYISKPYLVDELEAMVRRHLSLR
jgi:CheY-like chemotaxis protein